MEDRIRIVAVIRWHVVGDYFVGLESVASSAAATRSIGLVDVGTVLVKPEPVDLSQTGVNVKWGRGIVCVESEDRFGERDGERVSEGHLDRNRPYI